MKKTSFIFILILSVFFSYQNVFASSYVENAQNTLPSFLSPSVEYFCSTTAGSVGSLFNLGSKFVVSTGGTTITSIGVRGVAGSSTSAHMYIYNYSGSMTQPRSTGSLIATSSSVDSSVWSIFPAGDTTPSEFPYRYFSFANIPLSAGTYFFDFGDCNTKTSGINLGVKDSGSGGTQGFQATGSLFTNINYNTGWNDFGGRMFDYIINNTGYTPPSSATIIQNITPTNGSTTSSTSVVVSADYLFNNPDLASYQTPPIVLKAFLHRTDGISSPDQSFDFSSLTYNSFTHLSHTFTLPTNTIWELRFDISGDGYYFISPLSTPVKFNVVSDPSVGTSGYTTCNITNIGGCIQNALVYLFYPSSTSLNQFNTLYNQYVNKPPFGYVVAVQNTLKNINDTGTSVFTLQTMPILNTMIFDPIKIGVAWILWVAFLFMLYHRLKNIQL